MGRHLMWYRRDLRVADLPALHAAASDTDGLVCAFVLDPALVNSPRMSPARLVYLCAALADLDASLRARGSRLVLRRGRPVDVLLSLVAEAEVHTVHWSEDHTTYAQARDARVAAALEAGGARVRRHPGVAIQPPGSITTRSGTTYRVFTPFHAAWRRQPPGAPLPAPDRLPPAPGDVRSEALPRPADLALDVVPGIDHGGEGAAQERLQRFLDSAVEDYDGARDVLARAGTSRLSADLHYGCISAREIHDRLDRRRTGHATFAKELAWRDFYLHVMAAWPEIRDNELNADLRSLPWRGDSPDVEAWRRGRTGFPIVDAAMRQLLSESWMHNRARMIVASFLCKDLLADWRLGQAHFLRHLVDADVASNNGGWQWAAGTGTDAQPFFRIFNPVTQGERFDADGAYVRRHVPELAGVPDRWIHRPWEMPAEEAAACGLRLGVDYPHPILDHAEARTEALAFLEAHGGGRRPPSTRT